MLVVIRLLLRWRRLSVCLSVSLSHHPVGILTATYQGASYDAASVHFGPTTRMTDILVACGFVMLRCAPALAWTVPTVKELKNSFSQLAVDKVRQYTSYQKSCLRQ